MTNDDLLIQIMIGAWSGSCGEREKPREDHGWSCALGMHYLDSSNLDKLRTNSNIGVVNTVLFWL